MAKVKKDKKPKRGKLVKKLDSVFSKYIRTSKSSGGMCRCITCGKELHWKNIQNGHFKTRGHYKYRWDEDNCRPQCVGCNVFLNGNYQIYTLKMINMFGKDWVENIINDKEIVKISTGDIMDMIEMYDNKLKIQLETIEMFNKTK